MQCNSRALPYLGKDLNEINIYGSELVEVSTVQL